MKKRRTFLCVTVILFLAAAVLVPLADVLAANVFSNTGFESGSGSNATSWTEGTNHVRSSDRAHFGTYSLKSTYTGASTYTNNSGTGEFYGYNKQIYISYWVYREGTSGTVKLTLYNYINNYNDFVAPTTSGSWLFVSGSVFVNDAERLEVFLYTINTAETVYFDDVCVSLTQSDCAETTATPSLTSTATATETPTPTITNTPTETGTPTITPTVSSTPTVSPTPSPTSAVYGDIIWADGTVTLSDALQNAIGALLQASPPEDATSNVYATTNISGVDTDWNVSIVNLTGVDPPYDAWSYEEDVSWSWFVQCTGEEPNWSCSYYELPAAGAGEPKATIKFPWQSGYSAQYGVSGVHFGANILGSESLAVDFVGSDLAGANRMTNLVRAAADGTITSVCNDGVSMAFRVDGGVSLAYFHFDIGNTFSEGQTITQGQILGSLRYGTFAGPSTGCGWAGQLSYQYHLHFVFLPTSPGFFEIGGCVLDLATENFVCNGTTYQTLSWIPNGGNSSSPGTPVPGTTPVPGGNIPATGGAHIWDGIVDAIVTLGKNIILDNLPNQDPIVSYVIEKLKLIMGALLSIILTFWHTGITGSFLSVLIATVLGFELTLQISRVGMIFLPILLKLL